MRSFFSIPRRYDFSIPYYEAKSLPNKCQHLNSVIKKLILMKLESISVSEDYSMEGTILYTTSGDSVIGTKLRISVGRGILSGTRLIIQ